MAALNRTISTLLAGSAILFLGNGLLITLLPLRAQQEAFSTTLIGAMGTAYFGGFAVGCVVGPRLVRRVGHIRCFAGFAALAAAGALLYPLAVEPWPWIALRAMTGVCYAVLYMVVESWLNEAASNRVRGQVLSVYIIVANVVTIGGQLMVNLYDPGGHELFSLAALLVAISLVPLSLTSTAAPKPVPLVRFDLVALFRLSPTGFAGCVLVGAVEGAFWSLGPVFAQERGLSIAEITVFMGLFMAGGTLSQWPLGRLSDRLDRRWVIAFCCLGSVGTALALVAADGAGLPWRLGLAVAHGALMFPLYALCLAHANDFAPNERLVEVSSGLLLIYAVGAILGPLGAAQLMHLYGAPALFLAIAGGLALLGLFSLFRVMRRPLLAALERVVFVPVPRTTPSVYALEQDEAEEDVGEREPL